MPESEKNRLSIFRMGGCFSREAAAKSILVVPGLWPRTFRFGIGSQLAWQLLDPFQISLRMLLTVLDSSCLFVCEARQLP